MREAVIVESEEAPVEGISEADCLKPGPMNLQFRW